MIFKTLIVLFFVYNCGFSQIKIRLTLPDNNTDNYEYDYQFLNISDSAYVNVYHSSDMGHPYGRGYELKRDIPSGDYEIYINDIINSKVELDLEKKEMRKTIFNSKGIIKEIRYHKNEEFIKQDIFDDSGNYLYSVEPNN